MAVVLVTNLTAYIDGSAEVLAGFVPLSLTVSKLLFYIVAAAVVLFGLKAVGVSEKIAVTFIFGLIAVLAAASFFAPQHPLPMTPGTVRDGLSYFGMSSDAGCLLPHAVRDMHSAAARIKTVIPLLFIISFSCSFLRCHHYTAYLRT